MQEEFVMRKAEKELKKQLRQDVEIPSIVREKTDMAFNISAYLSLAGLYLAIGSQ